MARNRPKISEKLENMSRSDWETIIEQYIKSEEDRDIAIMYYLDGYCMIDIAEELHYSRQCINARLKKIIDIIEKHTRK